MKLMKYRAIEYPTSNGVVYLVQRRAVWSPLWTTHGTFWRGRAQWFYGEPYRHDWTPAQWDPDDAITYVKERNRGIRVIQK